MKKLDYALLLVRIVFGFRLIYGSIDNVFYWDRMLEFRDFLGQYGFPLPLVSAIVSVYAQFICGLSWVIGYHTRIASMVMVVNFLVAIVGVHILGGDPYLETAPAIHVLSVAVVLILLGPGKASLDRR